MANAPRLNQRISQRQQLRQQQVLAPQLQLAMQLLPLNTAQLATYLHQQVNANPALEWRPSAGGGEISAFDVALATQAPDTGLSDHLLWQLQLETVSDPVRQCAEVIIDALNSDGYLRAGLRATAEQAALPDLSDKHWRQALLLIQSFEPTGVGARNLSECLRLQLEQNHPGHPQLTLALLLAAEYLTSLARPDIGELAAQTGQDRQAVSTALELIHSLNPRPGAAFDDTPADYIRPDVRFVRTAQSNSEGQPVFAVELLQSYSRQIQLGDAGGGSSTQRREARSLLSALALREQSLLRVCELLARAQAGFLAEGPAAMRALTRAQVAEELGLHPSTVTRTLQGKYAETPAGVTPLSEFFSVALNSPAGTPLRPGESEQAPAAAAARARLAALIDNEDPRRPLADAELCRRLRQAGFPLARRTVVKYRQQLGIENSRKRRRV